MAEDQRRTKSEPLSERARRAAALEAAKEVERDLYADVIASLPSFPELQPLYRGVPLAQVQRELLDQREEALAAVESDRAEFRGAMAERFEARWQLRQAVAGLVSVAGLWTAGALVLVGFMSFYGFRLFRQDVITLIGGAAALIAASAPRGGSRVAEALRDRRRAVADLYAAESLLEKAIREVALPNQLRQIRRGRRPARRRKWVGMESRAEAPGEAGAIGVATGAPQPGTAPASPIEPIDPSNLVELYQSPQQLATAGRKRLKALVDVLGSASLGVAGPRGVGKSSLLRWFFDHQFNEAGHLSVLIPAPVRYEPRDFVLAAFAQLCEAVMGGREVPALPGRVRFFASTAAAVLGFAVLTAGAVVYGTGITIEGTTRHLIGAALMGLGALVLVLRFSVAARQTVTPRYLSNTVIRNSENPDALAPQLFNEISFQLTFATGYSGKLTAGPAELATETSYSLAARQESFPDVVTRFRAFLEAVARQRGKLYIGIDELDKMQVQDAVRFLDDIKGLFGVPNCFFLVCISEDALGQFQRRGLPMRDAFDSAFDEVVRLEPLQAGESLDLLNKRTEIEPELAALCHVLAGGLPRDVIRHARRLAILLSRGSIGFQDAARQLVHQDLQERARGIELVGDGAAEEDAPLRRLSTAAEPVPAAELAEAAIALRERDPSLACLALLAATLLELAAADPAELLALADELGAIRLSVSEDPHEAWSRCLQVRERETPGAPLSS